MKELLRLRPYLIRYRKSYLIGTLHVLITNVFTLLAPLVLKRAVDELRGGDLSIPLSGYAAAIIGLSCAQGIFRFWMRKVTIGASRHIEFDLRNDLFAHLESLSISFYEKNSTGDIVARATNDLNAVRMFLGPAIMYIANTVFTLTIGVTLMILIDWRLTLLALIPFPILSLVVNRISSRLHGLFADIQEQYSTLSTHVQENISGIRVVKAFVREEEQIDRFRKLNGEFIRRNMAMVKLWGLFFPFMGLLTGFALVIVVWYGGSRVIGGHLTLGGFIAFLTYLGMLTWPAIAIGWVLNLIQRGAASMGRIGELLDTEPDVAGPSHAAEPEIRGAVALEHVSFAYNGKRVLHDINLSVSEGETVAIVGAIGSGKSTLLSLIPRLYDPVEGVVRVDNIPLPDLPLTHLRTAIGFVPQETFLFSMTIRENIKFGAHDLSDSDVDRISSLARLESDLARFPAGLETMVGERGVLLSGGQKQRIALARALARNPRVLVLDDSLASVDVNTEEEILSGLREFRRDRTTLIVSHRLSAVRDADRVIVLEEGAIAETGTHEELIKRKGFYLRLYERQKLTRELEDLE